ncbi:MAG: hypothetical protein FDW93_01660 [Bergeyella sp.]|nr:hypothetical protein [Bergeyella sp.]
MPGNTILAVFAAGSAVTRVTHKDVVQVKFSNVFVKDKSWVITNDDKSRFIINKRGYYQISFYGFVTKSHDSEVNPGGTSFASIKVK